MLLRAKLLGALLLCACLLVPASDADAELPPERVGQIVQVPGAAQAPLSDARLAALMNWLIERFAGEKPDPPYTAAEVKQLRRSPLRNPLAKRAQIRQASPH